MTCKLKPVDDAPICDADHLQRIDPVWMPGPVPPRFWEDRTNRRNYLLWLADRLGLRHREDLYRLKIRGCNKRYRGGGLHDYWRDSPWKAVQDCFPECDWKPWLFRQIPDGFWHVQANRRSYMAWLGERLGFQRAIDWYAVTWKDFVKNRGGGLLAHYHRAPSRAVIDLIPGENWCEWKFAHVPAGFWEVAENRQRYLRWLGKELGYRRAEDWYRIQSREIERRRGSVLLKRYASVFELMREFLPQLDWGRIGRRSTRRAEDRAKELSARLARRPPKLTEEQILIWADAYFTRWGKWPRATSGPIPGTRESWNAIVCALQKGNRGLRSGCGLGQLLALHRGVRNIKRLPPLTERQILDWAKAYLKARGRPPRVLSGPIAELPGESWRTIDKALRKGTRGLRRGSSLSRLLESHGLK